VATRTGLVGLPVKIYGAALLDRRPLQVLTTSMGEANVVRGQAGFGLDHHRPFRCKRSRLHSHHYNHSATTSTVFRGSHHGSIAPLQQKCQLWSPPSRADGSRVNGGITVVGISTKRTNCALHRVPRTSASCLGCSAYWSLLS
jgi:hypothetical protein